jgi:cholesterol transport system auxiliary component
MSLRCAAWLSALLLGACSLGSPAPTPALFDLGPAPIRATAAARSTAALQLLEVTAPPWLTGTGIVYRLDYEDAFRRQAYRDSRWVAPPAQLLAERLRQRLAVGTGAIGAAKPLRLELEEFSQVFDTPTQSRMLLRVRALAGETPGQLRVFELSEPANTADAAGAVRAASRACDALIEQLVAWTGGIQ